MPPPRLPRRRRRRTGRRAAAVAALAVGFPVLAAGPASAHTELRSSSPRAGASVAGVASVDLWFTEPIDAAASHVWLADAAGYLPLGPATPVGDDPASLSVPVPAVGEGRYDVVWHVVAGDGAVVRGTVPFELTAATAAARATARGPAAAPEPARPVAGPAPHGHGATALTGTLARALLDASLATLIGGLAFVATVWPQGARLARTRRLLWAAAAVAALASIELAAVQYASASGLGIGDALSPSHQWEALQVRSGRLAVARVALLGLSALLAARLSRHRGPVPRRAVIGTATAVLAFGLAETMVLAGHATELGLAAGARLVHVLGVSAWVGGLVMLLCVVVPRRGADEMLAVLPRFSALATGAVAAVTVGGTVLAVDLVGAAGALPSTGYGRVLLAKLAVVALLLLAASVSRRNVRTSLAAGSVARPVAVWVGTEVGLLALVLGLTAVLVSQAPPG